MHNIYKFCPKDTAYEIPLYLDYWFTRTAFNVFPYISLSKIKHPLVGPLFGGVYFYAHTLQTVLSMLHMKFLFLGIDSRKEEL